jgi:hypothetical protein
MDSALRTPTSSQAVLPFALGTLPPSRRLRLTKTFGKLFPDSPVQDFVQSGLLAEIWQFGERRHGFGLMQPTCLQEHRWMQILAQKGTGILKIRQFGLYLAAF